MQISLIEQLLLFIMVFGLMLAVGCSLRLREVVELKNQRKEFHLALFLQYLMMPFWAIALAYLLGLSSGGALVLLLIACCPGGAVSNMFSYFSGGNVSLSLALTSLTSLLSFFMTPFLLALYAQSMRVEIPFLNIFATVSIALFPVLVGVFIQFYFPSIKKQVKKTGTLMGYIGIGLMFVIWTPRVFNIYIQGPKSIFFAIGLLSLIGISFAFVFSRLLQTQLEESRTLALETGIQNAPLAFILVQLNLPSEVVAQYGWIPLVYGGLSVGSAFLFTLSQKISSRKLAIIKTTT